MSPGASSPKAMSNQGLWGGEVSRGVVRATEGIWFLKGFLIEHV